MCVRIFQVSSCDSVQRFALCESIYKAVAPGYLQTHSYVAFFSKYEKGGIASTYPIVLRHLLISLFVLVMKLYEYTLA